MTRIALVGLASGAVLAADLGRVDGVRLRTWDVAFPIRPAARAQRGRRTARAQPNALRPSTDADLVISAVTAANDLAAARLGRCGAERTSWFLDLNSAAPTHKRPPPRQSSAPADATSRRPVMSPIEPLRLGAPILLARPHAAAFAGYAAGLGFTGLRPYADTVGPAAATKLCRSVVVKGLEALVTEAMLAAARGTSRPTCSAHCPICCGHDWEALAGYLISRSLQHGTRRAEEMREAAAMVAAAGIDPVCSQAVARRQNGPAPANGPCRRGPRADPSTLSPPAAHRASESRVRQ